jgi:hypothetical protein
MKSPPTCRVYVASMNLRGRRASLGRPCKKVNVTSAQRRQSPDREAFSPMQPIEGGYKGFDRFESYWQSGKVWEGIPHAVSVGWWKKQTTAKRRYPRGRGRRVLHAVFPGHPEPLDYVSARKKVYVPEYHARATGTERFKELAAEAVARGPDGEPIVVYDFDGPRGADREPLCREVTVDLLRAKIADTTHPFGHGYVVAAALLGIDPAEYAAPASL